MRQVRETMENLEPIKILTEKVEHKDNGNALHVS
jgi:hypothetical protein